MYKNKAHTKAGSKRKINFNDNSTANQRQKLLDYGGEHGSITTKEAQEKLDVYYPPARIKELRDEGYQIDTVWVTWTSESGVKHRIGKYVFGNTQNSEVTK